MIEPIAIPEDILVGEAVEDYSKRKLEELLKMFRFCDIPVDPRLSDDPLEALAAVMRHHNIAFETFDGMNVVEDSDEEETNYIATTEDGRNYITADDIKPECD